MVIFSGISKLGPGEIGWCLGRAVTVFATDIYWSRTAVCTVTYHIYTRLTSVKVYCTYHYIFYITFSDLASVWF